MSRLELKVPPDVVWVIVASLMWVASARTPRLGIPATARSGTAVVLTVAGVVLMALARAALGEAETTGHPIASEETTALLSTGVYGVSRNPVYLGMLLVLLGWAVLLSSPVALVVSGAFVLYIDRFQIAPEERALSAALGRPYADYLERVHRWV